MVAPTHNLETEVNLGFRNLTTQILAVVMATFIVGCDRSTQQDEEPTPASEEASANSAAPRSDQPMNMNLAEEFRPDFAHEELVILEAPAEVPSEFSSSLADLLDEYLALTAAFVSEDTSQVDAVAGRIRASLAGITSDGLNEEAAGAWASHRDGLETALHQLEVADTIEVKRQHLSHISEALYCALASFDGVDRTVYLSFCPMALDGAGAYWLASTREIANPYFGEAMLRCGEVRHEL